MNRGSGRLRRAFGFLRVFLTELLYATSSVDDLLLAGVEGMAVRAYLDVQLLFHGGARLPGVAAAADDLDVVILGVDTWFHDLSLNAVRE